MLKRCFEGACKVAAPIKKKLLTPPDVVSVIRLEGVIGKKSRFSKEGLTAEDYAPIIKKAVEASRSKALIAVINSPGGSPVQSELIANELRYQAARKSLPLLTFIEDVGASGGYWLACAGDEVYAMESSIVGSIGVIAAGFGLHEFIEKHGVERRVYTSGKSKALLDPFQPEKPADVKTLKAAQSDVYEHFVSYVKSRRAEKLSGKESELFSGTIYSGRQAKELGLVDDITDFYSLCRERFGDKIEFKSFEKDKGFLAGKLGMLSPAIWANTLADVLESRATHWGWR